MSYSWTLDKIIKPEYRNRFVDWEKYSSDKDKFGLSCIEEIYLSQGKSPLHIKLPI